MKHEYYGKDPAKYSDNWYRELGCLVSKQKQPTRGFLLPHFERFNEKKLRRPLSVGISPFTTFMEIPTTVASRLPYRINLLSMRQFSLAQSVHPDYDNRTYPFAYLRR